MLVFAEEHGQQVAEQQGASTVILVDLLGRSGQLEKARKVVATRRDSNVEEIIARVLDYEIALLDKGDESCHTIGEALGESE